MEIGIIGLPLSGKTATFTALTRVAPIPGSDKLNIGVARVPDPRLAKLAEIFKPRRVVHAEVTYVDFSRALDAPNRRAIIEGDQLNRLQQVDALLNVVRDFSNASVVHPEGSVDPFRDIETMNLELVFSDLTILERRLARLENESKSHKANLRDAARQERQWLGGVREALEGGIPIRDQGLPNEQAKQLANFQCLTTKPIIHVLNTDEEKVSEAQALQTKLLQHLSGPGVSGFVVAAQLEAELAQMEETDAAEFRQSMGGQESGLALGIRSSYELLGLVSFLTVGEDEVRAWSVPNHTEAMRAAGKIHSDLERGFIRAEVVRYQDLIEAGSLSEAKNRGLLRTEGRTYPVQDGDIMHVLFSV